MAAVGPLHNATSVYVVVIAMTLDKEKILIENVGDGTKRGPDQCEDVSGKD